LKIKVWGARGSIPSPGPETNRYGGNTSCVSVTLEDGTMLVLDAGTGIRNLGLMLAGELPRLHILLTHLHLDHIQGLMFFAPLFRPNTSIVVWGPAAPESSLQDRIGRYISAPLAPVEVRELPCDVSFREAPATQWQLGSATIEAASVTHRGPTLGYRITDAGKTLTYIPDHEPGLGADLNALDREWISGFDLAHNTDLLIHDCQYTDAEYPNHLGWGHAPLNDAVTFAKRAAAKRLLLFHHDPLHSDDMLDAFAGAACERWTDLGGRAQDIEFAAERRELELVAAQPAPAVLAG
jgi:phosphoribosyl 1,2-cyclic phosphodiesterase